MVKTTPISPIVTSGLEQRPQHAQRLRTDSAPESPSAGSHRTSSGCCERTAAAQGAPAMSRLASFGERGLAADSQKIEQQGQRAENVRCAVRCVHWPAGRDGDGREQGRRRMRSRKAAR